MKKICIVATLTALTIFPPQLLLPVAGAEGSGGTTLTRGTPVYLRLTQLISSETSHLGDLVHLEVLRDVVVDGKVLIKAGTPAEGEIAVAADRGWIGDPGRIGLTVKATTAVDQQTVYLRATLHREGEDNQTMSLILGLAICFLFLFMKGEEAELMAGSEVKAYVDNDLNISV